MRTKKYEIKCNECGKKDEVPSDHNLCLMCREKRKIKRTGSKADSNCNHCKKVFEYLITTGKPKWCKECFKNHSLETLKSNSTPIRVLKTRGRLVPLHNHGK